MKFTPNEKYNTISVYVLIVTFVTLIFIIIGVNIDAIKSGASGFIEVLKPIIYGFVISFLLLPLVNMFEKLVFGRIKKSKPYSTLRRALSLFAAFTLAAVFLMLFGFIFIPQVSQNYREFESRVSEYIGIVQEWLMKLARESEFFASQYAKVSELIGEFISDWRELLGKVTPIVISIVGQVVTETKNIALGVIIAIYFLLAKEKLAAAARRIVRAAVSDKLYGYIMHASKLTFVTFSEFIIGETLDSILMGMILFTLMNIFGMPYASFISLIVGVTFFIPSIGGYIGAVPTTLIMLIAAPGKVIWFLLIIIGLQIFDGIFIEPKILSEQNSMSAMWVLIAIIVMSALLGFWGLIVGVPLFMVIRTLVKEALEARLKNKGLPVSTSDYMDGEVSES